MVLIHRKEQMDSNQQRTISTLPVSREAACLGPSGVSLPGDKQPKVPRNSQLCPSFENSLPSISGTGHPNYGSSSAEMNPILSSAESSGPSIANSSVITDGSSILSGELCLQRNASMNLDAYPWLPVSALSFKSNSVSNSAHLDGLSMVKQEHNSQQVPTAISSCTIRSNESSNAHFVQSLVQEPSYEVRAHKKPRMDLRQEELLNNQFIQQILQRRDSNFQGNNSEMQVSAPPQRILQQFPYHNQQQTLQSLQHIPQPKGHQHPYGMQPASSTQPPTDNMVLFASTHRVAQYLYHQRHCPSNSIHYWRKFVAEYFSPLVKKRWCISYYENAGRRSLGIFPSTTLDSWKCNICGSTTGRGFESTYEALPRLMKNEYDTGVIDELLFLGAPRISRYQSGIILLDYQKAVQESIYKHFRVVHEGHLRITFTPNLKILSWEFCVQSHEELLSRTLVVPQVNQLLQAAQRCQNSINSNIASGVSSQDLQANCNMFILAGRQLSKNLELKPSLHELGFTKDYVRSLQVSEVVNNMKDLMKLSLERNIGPLDTFRNFAQLTRQPQYQQQPLGQCMPNKSNVQEKVTPMSSTVNGGMDVNSSTQSIHLNRSDLSNQTQPMTIDYNKVLFGDKSSNHNVPLQRDLSTSNPNSSHFPLKKPLIKGSMPPSANGIVQSSHLQFPQDNQSLQSNSINSQSLPEMMNTNAVTQGQNICGNQTRDTLGSDRMGGTESGFQNGSCNNTFRSDGIKRPDENDVNLGDDFDADINHFLSEVGIVLNNDAGNMGFSWKS